MAEASEGNQLIDQYNEKGFSALVSNWRLQEAGVVSAADQVKARAADLGVSQQDYETFFALSGDAVTNTLSEGEDTYDVTQFVLGPNTDIDGLRARVAAGIGGWGVLPDGQAFVTPDQSRAIQAALVAAAEKGDLDDERLQEVVKEALEPKAAEEDNDGFELMQRELDEVGIGDKKGPDGDGTSDPEDEASVVQVDQKVQEITADNSQGVANNDLLTQTEVDSAMVTGATTEQTIEELMQQDANVQNAYNEVVGRLGYTSAQIEAMTPEELAQKMETEVEAVNLRYRSDTHDSNVAYLRNVPAYARALALQSAREDISTGSNAASDEVIKKVETAAGEDEPQAVVGSESNLGQPQLDGQVADTSNVEVGNQPTVAPENALTELIDREPVEPGNLADKLALSLMEGTDWQIGPEGKLIGPFTHPTVLKPVNDILAQIRTSGIDWKVTQENGTITFTPAENHHFVRVTYNPEDGAMDIERRNWTAQEASESLATFEKAIVDPRVHIEDALSNCFLISETPPEHDEMTDKAVGLLVDTVLMPQVDGSQNPKALELSKALRAISGDTISAEWNPENAMNIFDESWGPLVEVVTKAKSVGGFDNLEEADRKYFIEVTGIVFGVAAHLPYANLREVDPRNPEGTIPMRETYAKMLRPLVQNLFVGNPGIVSHIQETIRGLAHEEASKENERLDEEKRKKTAEAQAERDRQVEEEEERRKANSRGARIAKFFNNLGSK